MHPRQSVILVLISIALLSVLLSQTGWMLVLNDLGAVNWLAPFLGVMAALMLLFGALYLGYRYLLRDIYRISDELTIIRAGKSSVSLPAAAFPPLNRVITHINHLLEEHHQRRLQELPDWLTTRTFVVFDTETTGLHPSHGDEIISIGAVKIIDGVLQPQLYFNELVNPGKPISAASQAIHGISDAQVSGARTICDVLSDFRAYCGDAMLVGHNVGFDMRFLQIKEKRCGVKFDVAVLDTLLLGSALGKHLKSHALDELAALMGVSLANRHSALGDALITAQIFLKLADVADAGGFTSIEQLRDVAATSPYAKLTY